MDELWQRSASATRTRSRRRRCSVTARTTSDVPICRGGAVLHRAVARRFGAWNAADGPARPREARYCWIWRSQKSVAAQDRSAGSIHGEHDRPPRTGGRGQSGTHQAAGEPAKFVDAAYRHPQRRAIMTTPVGNPPTPGTMRRARGLCTARCIASVRVLRHSYSQQLDWKTAEAAWRQRAGGQWRQRWMAPRDIRLPVTTGGSALFAPEFGGRDVLCRASSSAHAVKPVVAVSKREVSHAIRRGSARAAVSPRRHRTGRGVRTSTRSSPRGGRRARSLETRVATLARRRRRGNR